jgi:tetratricopeptide (TPR) repeat protein
MIKRWGWLTILCLAAVSCAGPAKTGVDLENKAVSLNEAGYDYYRQSRFNLAQEKFSQALKYNRLIDRRAGIASNLNNLGVVARQQGDLDGAAARFQEALAINRDLGDQAALCETLNNLGVTYQAQGKLQAATAALEEALAAARTLPPGPLLALSLRHLGDVAREQRHFDLALNYYHQALMVEGGGKDPRARARGWERLGRTFLDLKDYHRAGVYLNDALREFRRLQDTNGIADALKGLTLLALARGDRQDARLQADLLYELYQARGQEQEAGKLRELLKQ